jgi:hypothetical protein
MVFDFVAHAGIVQMAAFVRTGYEYLDSIRAIDPGTFYGIGVNLTFDGQGHDDVSDHIHADIRQPAWRRVSSTTTTRSTTPAS